ncbi:hypothetical protein ACNQVK_01170 [Mycobacterium sp. 134]|uniref:hypothetical protein n=1 Tax=Mycobacterium sp. 134 TaxID=3400425 RepID=UPI003AB00C79
MSAGVKWVAMWFLAVCVPVSIPFAILVAVGILSDAFGSAPEVPYLPLFERLTGLGQLLPTGLALLYTGTRELFSDEVPAPITSPRGKGLYGATWFFGAIAVTVFVLIQRTVLDMQGSVPYDTQQGQAWTSLGLFAVCAWITFTNVYLSTPAPKPPPTPAPASESSDKTVSA